MKVICETLLANRLAVAIREYSTASHAKGNKSISGLRAALLTES